MEESQPKEKGIHFPHPHLSLRKQQDVPTIAKEHTGFNGWLAVKITNLVATMWCAYAFAILALISLPDAIKTGTAALIAWIAQTFLQLVLLSIMVGQKVAAAASDKQALQTYKDAEALLEISNDVHKLLKQQHPPHGRNPTGCPARVTAGETPAAPQAS